MNDTIENNIKSFINSYERIKLPKTDDWFVKEKCYLNYEKRLLGDLVKFLNNKYNEKFKVEDIKKMMKLYLLYPDNVPNDLCALSWDIVKRLIDIYDKDKRTFYIDVCTFKNCKLNELNNYLNLDIYEKFLVCFDKYVDIDNFNFDDYLELIDKVIEIQERIF